MMGTSRSCSLILQVAALVPANKLARRKSAAKPREVNCDTAQAAWRASGRSAAVACAVNVGL